MNTYQDYLNAGGDHVLAERYPANNGRLFVICPCGRLEHPFMVWDVSALHAGFNQGQAWACDQCLTEWRREKRPIEPGDEYLVHEEQEYKWAVVRGRARQHALDHLAARAVARLGTLRDDLDKDIARGHTHLAADRAKVHNRAGMTALAVDKTTITADNTDAATISGIPVGAIATIEGVDYAVTDGTLVLRASSPGLFKVKLSHKDKLPEEVTIDAS